MLILVHINLISLILFHPKKYRKIKFIDRNLVNLNLDNKIVLIESADPGYDWIFPMK